MCGVCAAFSPSGFARPDAVLGMVKIAQHRGPDGVGLAVLEQRATRFDVDHARSVEGIRPPDGGCRSVLGHCRLSVLDTTSASAQPYLAREGDVALTYNGEIYNFLELRTELEALGRDFVTTGDTEVLLAAIDEWGVAALLKLRGMFAFVHVDARSGRILVARDEFGIKPLYRWTSPDGTVWFASEIKQFSVLAGWRAVADAAALESFLLSGITDVGRATMFAGVEEVPPGTALVGRLDSSEFEEVDWVAARPDVVRAGEAPDFDAVLVDAVRVHLRSDVEVGACLSGGVDSSALVAIASGELRSQEADAPMSTFTARSSDPTIDESIHAAKVASCVGAVSQVVDVGSADLVASIGDLVWHQDLPFAGASVVAQRMVFRAISESGLKVVLDGQGADELLGGYDDYAAAAVIEAASCGRVVRASRLLKGFARVGRTDSRRVVQLLALLYAPEPMLRWARRRRLGAALRIAAALRSTPEARRHRAASPVPRGTRPWRLFDALRAHQLEHGLRMLLRYEDRNSMAVGIESRVPLLDRDLAIVCRRMGAIDLVDPGVLKAPLRRSLTDRLGPECWQRHDKIGFAVSQSRWMDEHLDTVVSECLAFLASFTTLTPIDGEALLRSMAADPSGSAVLWRVYCTAVWARVFSVLPA